MGLSSIKHEAAAGFIWGFHCETEHSAPGAARLEGRISSETPFTFIDQIIEKRRAEKNCLLVPKYNREGKRVDICVQSMLKHGHLRQLWEHTFWRKAWALPQAQWSLNEK